MYHEILSQLGISEDEFRTSLVWRSRAKEVAPVSVPIGNTILDNGLGQASLAFDHSTPSCHRLGMPPSEWRKIRPLV